MLEQTGTGIIFRNMFPGSSGDSPADDESGHLNQLYDQMQRGREQVDAQLAAAAPVDDGSSKCATEAAKQPAQQASNQGDSSSPEQIVPTLEAPANTPPPDAATQQSDVGSDDLTMDNRALLNAAETRADAETTTHPELHTTRPNKHRISSARPSALQLRQTRTTMKARPPQIKLQAKRRPRTGQVNKPMTAEQPQAPICNPKLSLSLETA